MSFQALGKIFDKRKNKTAGFGRAHAANITVRAAPLRSPPPIFTGNVLYVLHHVFNAERFFASCQTKKIHRSERLTRTVKHRKVYGVVIFCHLRKTSMNKTLLCFTAACLLASPAFAGRFESQMEKIESKYQEQTAKINAKDEAPELTALKLRQAKETMELEKKQLEERYDLNEKQKAERKELKKKLDKEKADSEISQKTKDAKKKIRDNTEDGKKKLKKAKEKSKEKASKTKKDAEEKAAKKRKKLEKLRKELEEED